MLNIVIPMAGRGSRFLSAGYTNPKPLIDIFGRPMIDYVVKNITPMCEHRFIFLCLKDHLKKYPLAQHLQSIAKDAVVIEVDAVTEGAASTVLLAAKYIDNDDALMIANSDQYVDVDINDYLKETKGIDGLIMTMCAHDNKWSFIRVNEKGLVVEVREKEVISNEATVGIYNFTSGRDFIYYAKKMIADNLRINGEFYVAPVYNFLIAAGKNIKYKNIGSVDNGMYGLGVPEDLKRFIEYTWSKTIFLD